MSNKVTIEIDSIDYQVLKDFYDRVLSQHQKKSKVYESFRNNECDHSAVEVAEVVYLGAINDFLRVLQNTFVMLVDSDPSLPFDGEAPEAPIEPAPEALAESASEESESSADNISSNDASNNDTSSDDVVNEDDDELPFPMDDATTLGFNQRVITVSLSDEDCDRLTEMCGVRDVSVDVMLQNFVRDLVKSRFSNRPEDIINANLWFDNCWFSHNYKLLLGWLLSNDFDPYDDLIRYMESIEQGESDLLEYEVNPGGFDLQEMEYLKEDMKDWKEHIGKIRRQFLATYPDANWTCEFEDLETWYKERELFKNIRVRYLNKNK